ncbi:MAG: histone-fold-containing protein [Benniella sp.]|nr:MAG: histone-fold-containing protein [Benniella sp.]
MYDSYHQHSSASSSTGVDPKAEPGAESSSAQTTAAASATAPQTALTPQQLQQQQFAQDFWEEQIIAAEQFDSDFKNHPLPLARIKKVMKSDPEVKMISAEAPILFSKACEIFICEITRRAWLHAEENKRRTLQRSDVASASSRSDQFDFLIDIVPREEPPKANKRSSNREDPAPEAEAYEEHQQQYAQYYPQAPGSLASYSHAIDPQFYQVSHDHFQQYMQYQQAYAQQQQQQQHHQQPPVAAAAAATVGHHSRSGSAAGYAQEAAVSRS